MLVAAWVDSRAERCVLGLADLAVVVAFCFHFRLLLSCAVTCVAGAFAACELSLARASGGRLVVHASRGRQSSGACIHKV